MSTGLRVATISMSNIVTCPKMSLAPAHYHSDGRCRCADKPAAQQAYNDALTALHAAEDALRIAREALNAC